MDYILRKIDNELWKKVKVLAAMRSTSVREIILTLLKNEVKDVYLREDG